MHKIILFIGGLCLSFAALAEQCKEYKPGWIGGDTWYPTAAQACGVLVDVLSSSNPQNTYSLVSAGPGCYVSVNGGGATDWGLSSRDKDCEPPRCAADAGTSSVMNFTVGWARSGNPDADDHVGKVVFPNQGRAAACVGGCSWEFTDNGVAAYRSAEPFPASGLHRLSVDFTMRGAGTACAESPEDAAASPNAPEPPCPGFVGEVNGVKKCVGTASQPVPPPDGPTAGRQAGGGEDNGNPAAGKKPGSGEGSGSGGAGRTPTAGSGGNAGGPAGAAGGPKPDGTTPTPGEGKEQAACGAPGQPKCSINEAGTPSPWDENKWDSKVADYRRASDDALGQIKEAGAGTFDGFASFFMAPPLAACEPLEFPGDRGSLSKQCEVVDGVRSVMAYIWALGALWLCLGWIKKATA